MKAKKNIIYIWREKDIFFGATNIKGKAYGCGFEIAPDPNYKLGDRFNHKVMCEKRAKRDVEKRLQNTLNAVNLYGDKVFNKDGRIEFARFELCELDASYEYMKKNKEKLDLNMDKEMIKYKVKDITPKGAKQLGISNDSI